MEIIKIEDINTILPLHKKIFNREFPLESYYKKSTINPVHIFVYSYNKELVGYSLIVEKRDERSLYAWYGGVIPEAQGQGITHEFFQYIISWARDLEYESVTFATHNTRPHMIILAVKMGFDIYDLKKRDGNDGNKIYFKYSISEKKKSNINLNGLTLAEIEGLLVKAYKDNCTQFDFKQCDDIMKAIYIINYCSSFAINPDLIFYTDDLEFSDETLANAIDNYPAKIKVLKMK